MRRRFFNPRVIVIVGYNCCPGESAPLTPCVSPLVNEKRIRESKEKIR
ncbi:MAG: hypothetical protein ACP5M7_07750 [Thermoproteota archaeon]